MVWKVIYTIAVLAICIVLYMIFRKKKYALGVAIASGIIATILGNMFIPSGISIFDIFNHSKESSNESTIAVTENYDNSTENIKVEVGNQITTEEKKNMETEETTKENLDIDTQTTTEETTDINAQTTTEETTTISTLTTVSEDDEKKEDVEYLKFMGENHTPSSFTNKVEMSGWENEKDYDLEGRTYNGGIKISIYNMFSALDGNTSSISTEITSEIHYSLNRQAINELKNEDRYFVGKFVVGEKTDASPSTAIIYILIDGEEVYNSGEINCYSLDIPSFRVSLDQKKEMVIKIVCQHKGNPFVIGMVNNE